ncbi:MAG: peptidoglycan DD-metalloendopeptidase family protein [Acidimicrobiia bacterium]|nr:peptidoglycan DD-metalloendopeptidase family protein [Acidimicrobiia bacterium]
MRRAFPWLVLFLLCLGLTPVVFAQSQSELDELRREIAELDEKIDAAEAEKSAVAGDLAVAQEEFYEAAEAVDAAQVKVDAVQAEIDTEEVQLAEIELDLDTFKTALAATEKELTETETRVVDQTAELYMATATQAPLVFEFTDTEEIALSSAYVDDALGNSAELAASLEGLRDQADRERVSLAGAREEQQTLLAALDEKRGRLQTEVDALDEVKQVEAAEMGELQALVDGINANIAAAERHKDGLEADSARIEDELARRAARQREEEQQNDGGGGDGGGAPPPGANGWVRPVPGGVSSGFGYRTHPISGARKLHTGLDMSAGCGEPIYAANGGTVVTASWYGGYGNAIIIDHGGGVATLYAHQTSFAVGSGTSVSAGQVVGYVGTTGYSTGCHLHFEVRLSGTPVDPSPYIP